MVGPKPSHKKPSFYVRKLKRLDVNFGTGLELDHTNPGKLKLKKLGLFSAHVARQNQVTFLRDEQAHQLARAREHHEPGAARTLVDGTDQWAKIFRLLLRAHHQISHDRKKSFGLAKISESLGLFVDVCNSAATLPNEDIELKTTMGSFL